MRLKGIWIAIGMILVMGIGATNYTKSYISSDKETANISQISEQSIETQEDDVQESETGLSLLGNADPAKSNDSEIITAESDLDRETATSRLRSLDAEITQRTSAETDTTPNARKAAMENEWKIWENQMNRFLDTLEKQLEPAEWETLFKEQKEWLRTREEDATKGSGRQSGSTFDEIEYTRLIKESTRLRTYELAERYGNLLSDSE